MIEECIFKKFTRKVEILLLGNYFSLNFANFYALRVFHVVSMSFQRGSMWYVCRVVVPSKSGNALCY